MRLSIEYENDDPKPSWVLATMVIAFIVSAVLVTSIVLHEGGVASVQTPSVAVALSAQDAPDESEPMVDVEGAADPREDQF